MANQGSSDLGDRSPADELPEAFTMNKDAPPDEVGQIEEPQAEEAYTSTGLDLVDEGSEESFPASDPPSEMPPTTISRKGAGAPE